MGGWFKKFFKKILGVIGIAFILSGVGFLHITWLQGALLGASLMFAPKPKVPGTPEPEDTSQTYGFDGVKTASSSDAPIPLVFGKHIVGGNIINAHISAETHSVMDDVKLDTPIILENIEHLYNMEFNLTETDKVKLNISVLFKKQVAIIEKVDNIIRRQYWQPLNYTARMQSNDKFLVYYASNVNSSYKLKQTIDASTMISNRYSYYNNSVLSIDISCDMSATTHYIKIVYIPSSIESTYNNYWHNSNSIVEMDRVDGFRFVSGSYTTEILEGGTQHSAQTLYLDVGLSEGEIANLNNVYLNDQEVSNFHKLDINGNSIPMIDYSFRRGYIGNVYSNLEESKLTTTSQIYNTNFNVLNTIYSMITEDGTSDGKLVVNDATIFVAGSTPDNASIVSSVVGNLYNSDGTLKVTPDDNVFYVYEINGNELTIYRSTSDGSTVGSPANLANDYYKAGKNLYTTIPKYTDFNYDTNSKYVDNIIIGISYKSGLYGVYSSGENAGKLYTIRSRYNVTVYHKDEWDSLNTLATPIFTKELICKSNKRQKQYFPFVINREDLPSKDDGVREYHIRVRKLTRDTDYDTYYCDYGMVVNYVEEQIKQDFIYSTTAYASLKLDANANTNGGIPPLKFDIDGLRLPNLLPYNYTIDTSLSTTSTIVLDYNSTEVNYHIKDISTGDYISFALPLIHFHGNYKYDAMSIPEISNDIFPFISYPFLINGNIVPDDGSLHYIVDDNPTIRITDTMFKPRIFRVKFKCDGEWLTRYCYISNKYIGDPLNDPNYAEPDEYITQFEIVDFSKDQYKLDKNDAGWLIDHNTPLPSIPTDMIFDLWTDNPANAILYLLIDEENGLGIDINRIDLDSFREASYYYNEHIEDPLTEGILIKRNVLNYVIDTKATVRDHITKILSTCHSLLYEGDIVKLVVDKKVEDTDIITHLDEDNDIIDDINITTLPKSDTPNQLIVTYFDADDMYNRANIVVEDAILTKSRGYNEVNSKSITLYGVTDKSHAFLEGLRVIKTGKYIKYAINIKTALSGLNLSIFDVFTLSSTTYGWIDKKFRVVMIKYNEDQTVEISAVEYYDEVYDVSEEDLASYETVQHSDLNSMVEVPEPVSDATIFEENFRKPDGSVTADLVAHFNLPQNEVKFDDDDNVERDYTKEYNKFSHVMAALYDVTNIPNPLEYSTLMIPEVQWTRFDEEVRFKDVGLNIPYRIAIRVVNKSGTFSEVVWTGEIIPDGKKLPPEDITNFEVYRIPGNKRKAYFKFDEVSDFDLKYYVVRYTTDSTKSFDDIVRPFTDKIEENEFLLNSGDSDIALILEKTLSYYFHIKALDTSGNYSITDVIYTTNFIVNPDDVTNFIVTQDSNNKNILHFNWDTVAEDRYLKGYILKVGETTDTWDTATLITSVDEKINTYTTTVSYSGTKKFFIKAYDSYTYDNESVNAAEYTLTFSFKPNDITNFTSSLKSGAVSTYNFNWDKDTSGYATSYCIKIGDDSSTWDTASIYTTYLDVNNYPPFEYTFTQTGDFKVFIKAYNKDTKEYSTNASSVDISITTIKLATPTNLVHTTDSDDPTLHIITWDANIESTLKDYIIYIEKNLPNRLSDEKETIIIDKNDELKVTFNLPEGGSAYIGVKARDIYNVLSDAVSTNVSTIKDIDPPVVSVYQWYSNMFPISLHLQQPINSHIKGAEIRVSDATVTDFNDAIYYGSYSMYAWWKGFFDKWIGIVQNDITKNITGNKIRIWYRGTYNFNKTYPSNVPYVDVDVYTKPAAVDSVSISYNPSDLRLHTSIEYAKKDSDFLHYEVVVYKVGDDPETTYIRKFTISDESFTRVLIQYGYDGESVISRVRAVNKLNMVSDWVESTSIVIDNVPSDYGANDISIIGKATSLDLSFAEVNEDSFYAHEIHLSLTDGFTPSSSTVAATTSASSITIGQMPDGSVVPDSSTIYIKIRKLGKFGKGAYDSYNSAYYSTSVKTLDATKPNLDITDTNPSISPINVINDNQIEVTYSATDNTAISYVYGRVYESGTTAPSWTDITGTNPYTFYLTDDGTSSGIDLADGTYVFQLKAYDPAGNNTTVSRYFDKDTTAAPDITSVSATLLTSTGTSAAIQVEITYSEPDHFKDYIVEYAYEETDDFTSATWHEIRRTSSKTFIENINAQGFIRFRVKATKLHDTALTSTNWVSSSSVLIDNVAPAIFITGTTPDTSTNKLISGDALTMSFRVEDDGGLDTDCGKYSLDNGAYVDATYDDTNSDSHTRYYTIPLTGLSDGTHHIIIQAQDQFYNTSYSEAYYFEVDTAIPAAPDTPNISISGRTLSVSIPNFTKCPHFAYNEFLIYNASDNTEFDSFTSTNESGTYSFDNDYANDFYVKARQVKQNGVNGTLSSASSNVRVDTIPPELSITIPSNINENGYCKDNDIYTGWSSSDANGGTVSMYARVDDDSWMSVGNNPSHIDLSGYSDGSHTIYYKAVDSVGLETIESYNFILDRTPPADISGTSATFERMATYTWTNPSDSDFAGVLVKCQGSVLASANITSVTIDPSDFIITNDTIDITVQPYDLAGNYGNETTITATNLAPATPTGLAAIEDGLGVVTFTWDKNTESDFDKYKVYWNIQGVGGGAVTSDNQYTIAFTTDQLKVANPEAAFQLKAIDMWGKESSLTAIIHGSPRAIEYVDMGNNPFRYTIVKVANGVTTDETADSNLTKLIDGDFDNDNYYNLPSNTTNDYFQVSFMTEEWISGIKVAFSTTYLTESANRFYLAVSRDNFASDITYIAAYNDGTTSYRNYGSNLILAEYTSQSDAEANYIWASKTEYPIMNILASLKADKKRWRGNSVRLYAADGQDDFNVVEIKPIITSLANEFYGETLHLSDEITIASSDNVGNVLQIDTKGLELYDANSSSTVKIGELDATANKWGAWFPEVYIGGTTYDTAPIIANANGVSITATDGEYEGLTIKNGSYATHLTCDSGLNQLNVDTGISINTTLAILKLVSPASDRQTAQNYIIGKYDNGTDNTWALGNFYTYDEDLHMKNYSSVGHIKLYTSNVLAIDIDTSQNTTFYGDIYVNKGFPEIFLKDTTYSDRASSQSFILGKTSDDTNAWGIGYSSNANEYLFFNNYGNGGYYFYANGSYRGQMNSSGNWTLTDGSSDLAGSNYKLYVDGGAFYNGSVTFKNTAKVRYENSGGSRAYIGHWGIADEDTLYAGTVTAADFNLITNNSTRLNIDSSGNSTFYGKVYINSGASDGLHIISSTSSSGIFMDNNDGSQNYWIYATDSVYSDPNVFRIGYGSNDRLKIYKTGHIRVTSDTGYVEIGPQNTSYCHFITDRDYFYFNKELYAVNKLQVYNTSTYLTSTAGYIAGNEIWHKGNDDTLTYDVHTSVSASSNLAVGWYTIAAMPSGRGMARFTIKDTASGRHSSVVFYAGDTYGTGGTITTLTYSRFSSTQAFSYIRIKDAGTYDGAVLQIYVSDATNTITVYMAGDNFQSQKWVLKSFIPDATDPGTVTNYASMVEVAKVSLLNQNYGVGGIATSGYVEGKYFIDHDSTTSTDTAYSYIFKSGLTGTFKSKPLSNVQSEIVTATSVNNALSSSGLGVYGRLDVFDNSIPFKVSNITDVYDSNPTVNIIMEVRYNSSNAAAGVYALTSGKENITDGDYSMWTALSSRRNGQISKKHLLINSYGNVTIGGKEDTDVSDSAGAGYKLYVDGVTDSNISTAIYGKTSKDYSYGVYGYSSGYGGRGVYGYAVYGYGLYGYTAGGDYAIYSNKGIKINYGSSYFGGDATITGNTNINKNVYIGYSVYLQPTSTYDTLPTSYFRFKFKYNSNGDYADNIVFRVRKEDTSDGYYGNTLTLYTRMSNESSMGHLLINSYGNVTIGGKYNADVSDLATNIYKLYVDGYNDDRNAIYGKSNTNIGVQGSSESSYGIYGYNHSGASGVWGDSYSGYGVSGSSSNSHGVYGSAFYGSGVYGTSQSYGVRGYSAGTYGIYAETGTGDYAIYGNKGIYINSGSSYFGGDVNISGNLFAGKYGIFTNTTDAYSVKPIAGIQLGVKYNSSGDTVRSLPLIVNKANYTDGDDALWTILLSKANGEYSKRHLLINEYGGVSIGGSATSDVGDDAGSTYRLAVDGKIKWTNRGTGTGTNIVIDTSTDEIKQYSSSIRYKTNVETLVFDIDRYYQLRPVRFNWISNGDLGFGFIAEEALTIYPELVMYNPDHLPEAFNYMGFIPYMYKAQQIQKAEIDQLKEELSTKDSKIAELEDRLTKLEELVNTISNS